MPKRLPDLTGKKFGRLTAMWVAARGSRGRTVWLFACDCGAYKAIQPYYLTRTGTAATVSCGCQAKEALRKGPRVSADRNVKIFPDGKRFTRLRIVEYAYQYEKNGRRFHIYLVRCDCGTEKYVRHTILHNGDARSCGCLKEEYDQVKNDPVKLAEFRSKYPNRRKHQKERLDTWQKNRSRTA